MIPQHPATVRLPDGGPPALRTLRMALQDKCCGLTAGACCAELRTMGQERVQGVVCGARQPDQIAGRQQADAGLCCPTVLQAAGPPRNRVALTMMRNLGANLTRQNGPKGRALPAFWLPRGGLPARPVLDGTATPSGRITLDEMED